jgi:signal transduction histidine kinase
VLVEQVSPESLVTSWSSEAQRRAVREADVRSVMAIPLRARGVVVGVLTVASSRRSYGQSDVRLLERFAERAALAIDQARLFADTRRAVGIRDDVLAVVSQDLRAPVVTFGVVEQLLRQTHEADATKLANWADILRRALEEMHLLIDDLMDIARIQSGTFAIDLEGGPLSAVVTPVVDQLRLVAEARQQVLVVDLPDTLPRVRIDRPRLRRVIANLVGNAIKFTGERGRIGVSARQHRNTVVVSVSDNGPGIPPDQAVRVFDRFWQGNRATPAGSGLGLSIAKGIVEAHGGHIWVDSDIGLGAVFSFSLPLDTAVVATVVPRDRISPPVSQSPQA